MSSLRDAPALPTDQALLSGQHQRCVVVNIEHVFSLLNRAGQSVETRSGDHPGQVAAYALLLAQRLGLSHEEQLSLRKATLLHDIGKLGIAESIWTSQRRRARDARDLGYGERKCG